ncbi:MAG: helix-turn-helix transcriptional regulator [Coleofasciculaceae cyanobacterium RL_1_1]|nr:helix-turn-helix transcriptional regulator [Coleofasciculaceae cyanobacterium RL_1_1]
MTDSTNVCLETSYVCPIQFVVDLLDNKWSILVLRELFRGPQRTHQLLDALPGISTKILTARLRTLEKHGLLTRQVFPEIPPRVEYSLTQKGSEIRPILLAMHKLGNQWLDQAPCRCTLSLPSLGDQAASELTHESDLPAIVREHNCPSIVSDHENISLLEK